MASLLQLKDMGKLLPCLWYDVEVEDDGLAKYVYTTPSTFVRFWVSARIIVRLWVVIVDL